jgi:DNA-binding NarL/FixJ family response regulator
MVAGPVVIGAATARGGVVVLAASDEELLGRGMRATLGGESWVSRCLHATSVAETVRLAASFRPQVVLVSAELGAGSGVDLAVRLAGEQLARRVAVLAAPGEMTTVAARLQGVGQVLSRRITSEELRRAVFAMATNGERWSERPVGLSDRAADVLALLTRGATNAEIATALGVSPETVKDHVSRLLRTLQARNRTELVARAQAVGLVA